jgi:molybdate transport system substrate-binding protein
VQRRSVAIVALALLLGACADGTAGSTGEASGTELVVFAAASLTDALEEVAEVFASETGVRVLLNLAGSQTLATQLVEGAPADVFIAADATQMDVVAAAGLLAGSPVPAATNALAIAVEPGNPLGVTGLADLARSDLLVVLAAEQVPAGRYAREVLGRVGVVVQPASLEQNVRAALAKVAQGEADAAIVYASDVVAARGRVDGVAIPVEQNVVASYPVAVLAGTDAPDAAAAFVALLLSDAGQDVLRAYGFTGR